MPSRNRSDLRGTDIEMSAANNGNNVTNKSNPTATTSTQYQAMNSHQSYRRDNEVNANNGGSTNYVEDGSPFYEPISVAPPQQQSPPSTEPHTDWTIDYQELEILREVGRGAYGRVFEARWRATSVAVKQLNVDSMTGTCMCVSVCECVRVRAFFSEEFAESLLHDREGHARFQARDCTDEKTATFTLCGAAHWCLSDSSLRCHR